jgi:hypothetical protein
VAWDSPPPSEPHIGTCQSPKADVDPRSCDLVNVPKAAVSNCSSAAGLFDQLVRSSYEGERHCETECFRRLEVDDQLHSRGLLHGQVGRLLALENAAGIDSGQAVSVGKTTSICPLRLSKLT